MNHAVRRGTVALLAVVALTTAADAFAVPAAGADPLTSCTTSAGTIVAVDFAQWHGPIVRGCARQAANGLDLLHAAGFSTTGDVHDGPAFVCRMGNAAFASGKQYPTPSEDACVLTPPTTAYWSFWTAPAGSNHWSYSTVGAASDVPRAGEVELWTFGGTDLGGTNGSAVPAIAPNTLRAPSSAPPPPTSTPPAPAPGPKVAPQSVPPTAAVTAPGSASVNRVSPAPASVGRASSGPTTATHARRGATAPAATSTSARRGSVSPAPTSGANESLNVVAARPISAQHHSSSGATWSVVGAIIVLAALGAGTAFAVRRRRLASNVTGVDS
jgi:hypothetical protein